MIKGKYKTAICAQCGEHFINVNNRLVCSDCYNYGTDRAARISSTTQSDNKRTKQVVL